VDCEHCGASPAIGYAFTGQGHVCHTDDPARPDCYRRVTLYHEPLGTLKTRDPLPTGVDGIHVHCPRCGRGSFRDADIVLQYCAHCRTNAELIYDVQ
jgi:hypothetical protein